MDELIKSISNYLKPINWSINHFLETTSWFLIVDDQLSNFMLKKSDVTKLFIWVQIFTLTDFKLSWVCKATKVETGRRTAYWYTDSKFYTYRCSHQNNNQQWSNVSPSYTNYKSRTEYAASFRSRCKASLKVRNISSIWIPNSMNTCT